MVLLLSPGPGCGAATSAPARRAACRKSVVICRGESAIYEQSLAIVSSRLATLAAGNDITTADFEQLQQTISQLILDSGSRGPSAINIQRLVCSLLQIHLIEQEIQQIGVNLGGNE